MKVKDVTVVAEFRQNRAAAESTRICLKMENFVTDLRMNMERESTNMHLTLTNMRQFCWGLLNFDSKLNKAHTLF